MATVVSAPGKVLLAGGYLVLDPAYSGLVVATTARFYTAVLPSPQAPPAPAPIQIRVRSPQFQDATWLYAVHLDPAGVRVEQLTDKSASASKNKFVQLALSETLRLAWEHTGADALATALGPGVDITIVGDNDFYSQRAQLAKRGLAPTLESLAALPPFLSTDVRLRDVHKTGLGSSAALITSLVAALLLHLRVVPRSALAAGAASEGRNLAHNAAQYVHCLAQGKVGSGFDVAAAVFGSQRYTRFSPRVLAPLMDSSSSPKELSSVLKASWDAQVRNFALPPGTRLVLADVDAGSDTPSLVGRVLAWRSSSPSDAENLWKALGAANDNLGQTMESLGAMASAQPEVYAVVVKYLASLQSVQWLAHPNIPAPQLPIIEAFAQAHKLTEEIRAYMRDMGTRADVPIEPPAQTALLDASVGVAGVIGGGVPGAGGFDAIWILALDPAGCSPADQPARRVEALWGGWTSLSVSPLRCGASSGGGARVEALGSIPGLAELVA